MQEKSKLIKNIISIILMIVIIVVAYQLYKKYNFNDFTKAEYNIGNSKFERDSIEKCAESDSYKIENTNYNDAMFYKTVNVIPNTSYKITCRIKTKDVKTKKENTDSGAHICIANTMEKSNNVIETTDWTLVTFYFNSKNREEVDIGFRLGGFEDTCIRYSMVFRLYNRIWNYRYIKYLELFMCII